MPDQKNYILAIVLSLLVLFGWQYLYVGPRLEAQRVRQQALEQTAPEAAAQAPRAAPTEPPSPGAQGVAGSAPSPAPSVAAAPDRGAALAQSPRVPIDTPAVRGSINLRGGRLDDLALKAYRETVSPVSPNIVLFSPSGSPHPYYAEFGWAAAPGSTGALPGRDTLWTGSGTLTSTSPVTLIWDNGQGLIFRRTISIDDRYMFTVADAVENRSGAPVTLNPYGLVSRHGQPVTLGFFILHEGFVGVLGDNGLQEYGYSDVREDGPATLDARFGWLGITDKYWAATLAPEQGAAYKGRYSSGGTESAPTYQADFLREAVTVAPGETRQATSRLFAGAKEVHLVDRYEQQYGIRQFELLIDWGWFYFITKPMFYALDYIYRLVGNFGVAILVITVLLKALFFPLAYRSFVSMGKMKKVQPEMQRIRERFPDDRVKQQQALMELYKSERINPVSGCLPVLLQIPVFFALYKVLFVTIEMRHAPFFGWIQDLSAPDPTSIFNLFGLIPWSPPQALVIGVWPLLMGVTMWLQMRLNPTPPDPIQQTIFNWMPVIFTYMLAAFPAGLVIYWAWNNLLTIIQQYVIMRREGVEVNLLGNVTSSFRRSPSKSQAPGE